MVTIHLAAGTCFVAGYESRLIQRPGSSLPSTAYYFSLDIAWRVLRKVVRALPRWARAALWAECGATLRESRDLTMFTWLCQQNGTPKHERCPFGFPPKLGTKNRTPILQPNPGGANDARPLPSALTEVHRDACSPAPAVPWRSRRQAFA